MWAVGVGGMLLWVVNAVKAQNQTEQEGAPPNADPGGSADINWWHMDLVWPGMNAV